MEVEYREWDRSRSRNRQRRRVRSRSPGGAAHRPEAIRPPTQGGKGQSKGSKGAGGKSQGEASAEWYRWKQSLYERIRTSRNGSTSTTWESRSSGSSGRNHRHDEGAE
eukprot:15920406-Heterocapsa_arctica.AAC.1